MQKNSFSHDVAFGDKCDCPFIEFFGCTSFLGEALNNNHLRIYNPFMLDLVESPRFSRDAAQIKCDKTEHVYHQ